MKTATSGLATVCLAVFSAMTGCGGQIELDFSGFDEFRLERFEALGLCVPLDVVYSAVITRQDDGRYLAELTILTEIQTGLEDCPVDTRPNSDWAPGMSCPVLTDLPARELSGPETGRLMEVFGVVTVNNAFIPGCIGPTDPCTITLFTWDDREFSDFICDGSSRPHLSNAEVAEVTAFLEELRTD